MRLDRTRRARDQIEWLSLQGLGWFEFVEQSGSVLRRVIPHERFCFHTVDPATMLLTGGLARNLDRGDGYPKMVRNEYEQDDVNKWVSLAALDRPVGRLTTATDGQPRRSVRFRELLAPQQLAWELRASLLAAGECWGALGVYRSDGEADFGDADVEFLASVAPLLGEGFRRSLVVDCLPFDQVDGQGPGVILLDAHNGLVDIAPPADRWLEELRGRGVGGEEWLPVEVYSVATRARVGGDLPPRARVRAPSGQWLSLYGTRLSGTSHTAVIVQPAGPREVAPLILASYGLSARECEIAGMTLRGLSTKQIAAAASISQYTVQDHLKAIFEKTGIRSRRELSATLFFEHHFPRIISGQRPGVDGSFTEPTGRT